MMDKIEEGILLRTADGRAFEVAKSVYGAQKGFQILGISFTGNTYGCYASHRNVPSLSMYHVIDDDQVEDLNNRYFFGINPRNFITSTGILVGAKGDMAINWPDILRGDKESPILPGITVIPFGVYYDEKLGLYRENDNGLRQGLSLHPVISPINGFMKAYTEEDLCKWVDAYKEKFGIDMTSEIDLSKEHGWGKVCPSFNQGLPIATDNSYNGYTNARQSLENAGLDPRHASQILYETGSRRGLLISTVWSFQQFDGGPRYIYIYETPFKRVTNVEGIRFFRWVDEVAA